MEEVYLVNKKTPVKEETNSLWNGHTYLKYFVLELEKEFETKRTAVSNYEEEIDIVLYKVPTS